MANAVKQNWRYAQADRRWRNRIAWPTDDAQERALIRCELRREKIGQDLDRLWARIWELGYTPSRAAESEQRHPQEWSAIRDLMQERDRLARRSARLELATSRSSDDLLSSYRSINVKSTCY